LEAFFRLGFQLHRDRAFEQGDVVSLPLLFFRLATRRRSSHQDNLYPQGRSVKSGRGSQPPRRYALDCRDGLGKFTRATGRSKPYSCIKAWLP
jgi:hypothetical protein